ncbi:MAG: NAD-dependent epimerase/dehydratase family protein, partial [Sulfuritalea sp.]|nr:NAD-dependent epimerase/dehydratase family protein [Sulfuritalea sp.]
MKNQVLILGAAGRFGLAAVRAFSAAGWQVVGQIRPARDRSTLPAPAGVTWLPRELGDSQGLRTGAAGCQVVVHALNPPYTNQAWISEAPRMMQAAIDIAAALGATLMLPGNVYNFGESMPAELFEDTAQTASHAKGQVRIALERQLAAAADAGMLRAIVIRAGNFFGAGNGSMFDQALVKDLPKGKITVLGEKDVATPWAYLPDLAETFVRLAQRRAQLPAFEVFHFAGHCLNDEDWCEMLGKAARERGWLNIRTGGHKALKVSRFPWGLIRLGAPFIPLWLSLLDMRYLNQRAHRLNNAKLVAFLGSEPQIPLANAIAAA